MSLLCRYMAQCAKEISGCHLENRDLTIEEFRRECILTDNDDTFMICLKAGILKSYKDFNGAKELFIRH